MRCIQTCHSYCFYQYILIFLTLKFGKIQIFSGMLRVFPYTVLIHTDFFPKLLIYLVFYTDLCQIIVAGLCIHTVYVLEAIELMHSIPTLHLPDR